MQECLNFKRIFDIGTDSDFCNISESLHINACKICFEQLMTVKTNFAEMRRTRPLPYEQFYQIMETLFKIKAIPQPSTIEIGQLWFCKEMESLENLVAVTVPILTVPNSEEKFLKIVPLTPLIQGVVTKPIDKIIEQNEIITNMRYVFEYWNEIPISKNLLDRFIGFLPDKLASTIAEINRIGHITEVGVELKDETDIYRAKRMVKMTKYSRILFINNPDYSTFN